MECYRSGECLTLLQRQHSLRRPGLAWLIRHRQHSRQTKPELLEFNATVVEAEDLLHTRYSIYRHSGTGQQHIACEQYSVPANMKEQVDFVYPTVPFDAKLKLQDDTSQSSKEAKRELRPETDKALGSPGAPSLPKLGKHISKHEIIIHQLRMCDTIIVPDCLRALYNFPPNKAKWVSDKNSFGDVEYTPQAYVPSDLDMFFRNHTPKAAGYRPILNSIDGGVVQQTDVSFGFNGESDMDLEIAVFLTYPQDVTLYQVGDLVRDASLNNFLDAPDGDYYTFWGGDDPIQDAVYPNPLSAGFKGRRTAEATLRPM